MRGRQKTLWILLVLGLFQLLSGCQKYRYLFNTNQANLLAKPEVSDAVIAPQEFFAENSKPAKTVSFSDKKVRFQPQPKLTFSLPKGGPASYKESPLSALNKKEFQTKVIAKQSSIDTQSKNKTTRQKKRLSDSPLFLVIPLIILLFLWLFFYSKRLLKDPLSNRMSTIAAFHFPLLLFIAAWLGLTFWFGLIATVLFPLLILGSLIVIFFLWRIIKYYRLKKRLKKTSA